MTSQFEMKLLDILEDIHSSLSEINENLSYIANELHELRANDDKRLTHEMNSKDWDG